MYISSYFKKSKLIILFVHFFMLFESCDHVKIFPVKKKYSICYTSGTYDLFHVGHVNILRNTKGICDKLIVGIHPDEIVFKNKNKYPVIPLEQRMEILRSVKYVDAVVPTDEYSFSKKSFDKYKMDLIILGDDYVEKYKSVAEEMKKC